MELGLKELAYLSLVVFMLVFGYFIALLNSEEDVKNEDPKGSGTGSQKEQRPWREAARCAKHEGIADAPGILKDMVG